jgi:hypothetical protein
MLRLLADENFNNVIVRGLLRRNPDLDLVRVQDTEMLGAEDADLLEWAALENRVLLTHDAATIPKFAFARVEQGLPMSGVLEVNRSEPIGSVVDDILLLAEASLEGECANQVIFLPLR